jgi:hypothetical protein
VDDVVHAPTRVRIGTADGTVTIDATAELSNDPNSPEEVLVLVDRRRTARGRRCFGSRTTGAVATDLEVVSCGGDPVRSRRRHG